MKTTRRQILIVRLALGLLVAFVAPVGAQDAPADKPPIKQEELEQILAPIALYPDSLLSQIFMASTYPLEIVEADRWTKPHKDLKGDALATELEKQTWDPSVKSLVNFPEVLSTMSEKLDITQKIGDAFIADQKHVMDTVQSLRAKAQAAGNLKTSEQQKVVVEPAPAGSTTTQIIVIESPSPQVVYVPTYEPTVVYGTWPYPAYPPPPYYPPRPPGYVASNLISFGVGMACGAAWGYAWGGCNWGHGDVDIDVNRNVNFNTNINRSKYQAEINNRRTNVQGGNANSFQHDPSHRKGVPYRDPKSAQQFGGGTNAQAAKAREDFRGRAETGAAPDRDAAAAKDRAGAGATGNRDAPAAKDSAAQDRASAGTKSGALDGISKGGSAARADSQRGQASRGGGSGGGRR